MKKELENIIFNNNNIELLKIAKDLLQVVVNDVDMINAKAYEIAEDYLQQYDLGCENYIEKHDLESIVSIIDTINDIEKYNEEV